MTKRRNQFSVILLCYGMLIFTGCGSGGGTGDLAAATGVSCSSNKTCPTAEAGPDQTIPVNTKVTLDGSASSSGTAGLITYQWVLTSKPSGSTATLIGGTTVRPTLTPDVPGDYTVKLIVDNGGLLSKSDSVTITAGSGNLRPTADAGLDQTVPPGAIVALDGSGSHDPNGTSVTYAWTFKKQPPKSQASLDHPSSASPSFTADVEGTYKLNLTVSDGTLNSSTDQVEIIVTAGNVAPVADAGPDQQVTTGQVVTLTGSSSTDPNGDPLTYSWRFQSKPSGSTATLANSTSVTPNFVPDFEGSYVLSLIVNDGQLNSLVDTVVIDTHLPTSVGLALQAYVKASNTNGSGAFGFSVALDGNTLAVGAPNERSAATGVNGDQQALTATLSGAVYVFTRTNGVWSQQAYIKASNTQIDDRFGLSVALDGDTLAVGAFQEDSAASGINGNQADNGAVDSGAVYVFTRTNGIWSQQAYIKASNTQPGDLFGWSVALAGDTLAVGANGEDSAATGVDGNQTNNSANEAGAVYVFTRAAGIWSQQAYLKASNSASGDQFGHAVTLAGDTLAVAALGEASGSTGGNGNQADNSAPGSGAVYVFTRTAGTWSQQAYIKASNTEASDVFGFSIALIGDTLAVAALGEDSAATGINGNQTDNGAQFSGAVYVFTRTGGIWSQQAYIKASNTEPGDRFGHSVALDGVGDTLAVGANLEDSAATGVNGNQTNNSAPSSGAVYLFTRTDGIWSQHAYIKASNTGDSDEFGGGGGVGGKVALAGDTLVVGAFQEGSSATGVNGDQADNSRSGAGAVYVYIAQ